MPNCKACNAEFKERKDHNGQWIDLCWNCYIPSQREAGYAQEVPERSGMVPHEQLDSDWQVTLGLHDWGSGGGIGPLSEEDRIAHLELRATERFWDAIEMGADFLAAVDAAIGTGRFRGDQQKVT